MVASGLFRVNTQPHKKSLAACGICRLAALVFCGALDLAGRVFGFWGEGVGLFVYKFERVRSGWTGHNYDADMRGLAGWGQGGCLFTSLYLGGCGLIAGGERWHWRWTGVMPTLKRLRFDSNGGLMVMLALGRTLCSDIRGQVAKGFMLWITRTCEGRQTLAVSTSMRTMRWRIGARNSDVPRHNLRLR